MRRLGSESFAQPESKVSEGQMRSKSKRFYPKCIRTGTGASGMSEFGPALGVLLIFFFLPLVDMLSLGVSYGLCMVLNGSQVHESSLLPAADATAAGGTVQKAIPDQWLDGMGKFVKVVGYPQTKVTYRNGEKGTDQVQDKIVTVETTVNCLPFLPIPLPVVDVPGLNGPMTFQITSERQMENPDNAGP